MAPCIHSSLKNGSARSFRQSSWRFHSRRRWRREHRILAVFVAEETQSASAPCDRLGHRQRNRNMWPALISTFTSQKEHFNSDLQRVTFSSFLIVFFFPPPLWSYCVGTIKHWLFDPDLEGLLNTDTFKARHPFYSPLDSKNKGQRSPSLPVRPPAPQPCSNLLTSFRALALNIISRILQPPVLFPPLPSSLFFHF